MRVPFLFIGLTLFALGACNWSSSASAPAAAITGVTWRLEDMNRTGIIDNSFISVAFGNDGRISGRGGCNNFSGQYQSKEQTLTIEPNLVSTRMACAAPALMEQEQRYFELLPHMTEFKLDETEALVLSTPDGKTLTFRIEERH